jgi:hypothetical protein
MKGTSHLLEREDVNIKVNQVAILHMMEKYNLAFLDFKAKHCWINQGLNIPSKGVYRDGKELRRYADDRIFYTWARYEKLETGVPEDSYPKIFFQITVGEDLFCAIEEIERGVYDTAFAIYSQQIG